MYTSEVWKWYLQHTTPREIGRETELLGHPRACNCSLCFEYARRVWMH